ncbi:F-box/kelch-repeat protein At3g23880-like [Vicia villosa]|uniref:F-box/kelch-repeat protein At3g23880-like n=1 Tax=Vicia villosa TaxID=3911 RepID=UPI00273C5EE0|nr:F-box/kelch-repeat protein At3g23880-like [Vicia villosa]
MAKIKPDVRKKQPKSPSPRGRRKQPRKRPKPTLTPRRKQPEPSLTLSLSLHDHLPIDLVEEILCRLPVKPLIQLRCVCKSWNSLISENSNFAKKHLLLSTSNQARHHLILKTLKFLNLQSPISTIFNSGDATISMYSLREILKKGESDCDGGGYVSTCDGILCYKIDTSSAVLFNPSIRKFIILPPLEFPDQTQANFLYTLAYDSFINNYKVIVLIDHRNKREVNILTLGTSYWRRIDFPSHEQLLLDKNSNFELMSTSTGIFINDSVNWLTLELIVSLDLKKESYQKLSVPVSNVRFGSSCLVTLGTLKGCLSLLIPMMNTFSDIWIMKEFGNEKSWIKLLSIPYMEAWCPFRYSKADE